MNRYKHTGTGNPVRATDINHAAAILARREYGKSSTVGTLRHDCSTIDGAGNIIGSTWQAYIGRYNAKSRTTTGRNIWIYS
jgi:hypothetical protein